MIKSENNDSGFTFIGNEYAYGSVHVFVSHSTNVV